MGQIWCAGEGEYFDETAFEVADDDGVLIHKGRGHSVYGEPATYEERLGPLGESHPGA